MLSLTRSSRQLCSRRTASRATHHAAPSRAFVGLQKGGNARLACAAVAVDHVTTSAVDADSLAIAIKEAETRLQSMFAPGQRMPSAREVSQLRKNISEMKTLLATQMPLSEAAVNASEDQRSRQVMIEVEKSIQRLGEETSFQQAVLLAENETLRAEADELVMRRQQLLEVAYANGVRQRPEEAAAPPPDAQHPMVDPLEAALARARQN